MVGTERSAHETIQTRAVANDAAGETLVVTLTGVAAVRGTVTLGTSSVSTDVVDETLSVNEPTAGEGSAAAFTVTPSGAVYAVLSYRTADGSAGAPADYTAHSGTLTFGSTDGTTTTASSSAQTITVATRSDTLNEGDETFNLHLSWVRGSTGVGIATPTVPGTITDADDDALTVSVAAGAATVPEGSAATFKVTLAGATSTAPVVVDYEVGGTATAEAGDYTAPSGTLTIARGASTGTISIATRDEGVLDPGETLTVTLLSATSAGAVTLGTPATASTTIGDASEVLVTIDNTTVVEAETAVFTMELTGKVAADMTVGYSTRAGPTGPTGATAADYTVPAAGASVTVTAGETTATIRVATVDDVLAEADETFAVVLALPADAPTGVTLGTGIGTATIKDDRPAARLPGPGGGPGAGPEGPLAGPGSVAEGDVAVYTLSLPAGVAGDEADPGSGLTVAAGGRALVLRDTYGEWGLSGVLQLDPSAAGHGLSLRVRPAWGVTASGVDRLWEHGTARLRAGRRPAGRVEAEIGYGLPALGLTGVLTPFARAALSDAGARSLSLGGRLALDAAFDLTLEATRRESADPNAPPQHDLTLEGTSRW